MSRPELDLTTRTGEPSSTRSMAAAPVAPDEYATDLCAALIRIDTSNFADGSGPGERRCAEAIASELSGVGLDVTLYESAPHRTNVVTRIPGRDPTRAPLLLHGHTDVVPRGDTDWTLDPFSGEIRDGCVWGRGAVDMKDMLAMMVAVARDRMVSGRLPARDIVLAFFADEEAGGDFGARWMVKNHWDLFADCTEAVSEVGGFSATINDATTLYFIETARRGAAWIKATARGRGGHGSLENPENAVLRLCSAIANLGAHRWPAELTGTTTTLLDRLSDLLGTELDPDRFDLSQTPLAPIAPLVASSFRHTINPTIMSSGQAINLVPESAHAYLDCRFVPDHEDEFLAAIRGILEPSVTAELADLTSGEEAPFDAPVVEAMTTALRAEDDTALAVPYCAATSSDAASFHGTGVQSYGFTPLKLPADFNFAAMYHGVDERVPVESLKFGTRVLDRFLDKC